MTVSKSSSTQDNFILQYWEKIVSKEILVPRKIWETYKKVVHDIKYPGKFHYDDTRAKQKIRRQS